MRNSSASIARRPGADVVRQPQQIAQPVEFQNLFSVASHDGLSLEGQRLEPDTLRLLPDLCAVCTSRAFASPQRDP